MPSDISMEELRETDNLDAYWKRYCKVILLKAFPDPEAEIIRLQPIKGLRDSESKPKLHEALRANNNMTEEE